MTKNTKISLGLSILAGIGVAATAFIAHKRSYVYDEVRQDRISEKWDAMKDDEFYEKKDIRADEILDAKDEVIIFLKAEWPTLVSSAVTIGCIAGSQVLDIREIAAFTGLATAIGVKYKDLTAYLKRNYPEQYQEAMDFINAKKAHDSFNDLDNKRYFNKEETYDGRYAIYEPITEQPLYSKISPEEVADKSSIFINRELDNGNVVSVFDYIENLIEITGSKELETKPWMNKCGWCREDEVFDNNASYSPDGYFVMVKANMDDVEDEFGEKLPKHVLCCSIYPSDYTDTIKELYDI